MSNRTRKGRRRKLPPNTKVQASADVSLARWDQGAMGQEDGQMTGTLKIGDPWPFASVRGYTGRPLRQPVWHALIVAPQREAKTAGTLEGAGVEVKYPTVERTRHIQGKARKFIHPMISQIIYAKFSFAPNWDVMRSRGIITGVFSIGTTPLALEGDDISRVMGLPTEAERIEQERIDAETPRPGERAEIITGPFEGFFVDVTRVHAGRVWYEYIGQLGFKGEIAQSEIKRIAW
ncbi:MAG: transcription termination/antitermination protein NusG [Paracoccaceae bacterium]